MKTKERTHALFSSLNQDVFYLLLDYLPPLDAWHLAQTGAYLYQRVSNTPYWRKYLQKYFPFLRDWQRLALPDNTSPFQLFSLAYQQHMLTKTPQQQYLIKAIANDQLPFTPSSLQKLKSHFKLKETQHHIELKRHNLKRGNRHLADEVDETEFNAYCKYHIQQWFMESQCAWSPTERSSARFGISTQGVLISQGKIDEFFRLINSTDDYYKNRPASFFTPQLSLLLRLGYTNYIDQIIDFVNKQNFSFSFFFSFLNNCPYLSPLEYCIQYDDYDAFIKCYKIMLHIEPVKLLRPNTLIMMAQSPDPRYLDYVFKHREENRDAIVDSLQRQISGPEAHELELQNKIYLAIKTRPRDIAKIEKLWDERKIFNYDTISAETIYKKYGKLFTELRQQLYNVFAASIAACHRQKNEKTAKILLKKILELASNTTTNLESKKFKLNTEAGKTGLRQYFQSKQTIKVDDLYNTAIRLQPSKQQKAFLRKAWKELDGPEQTEGYWYLFFGIFALIVTAILLCAAAALLLLQPNIPLAIPIAIPTIAVPIMVTTAAAAIIGVGIYLLYRSHQLYNPTTDTLQNESRSYTFRNDKHNITYPEDTSYDPRFVKNFKSKFDANDEGWNNKINFPRFFGDNKTYRSSTCNHCNPTSKVPDLKNKMNFNFIM